MREEGDLARDYGISREAADAYAVRSHQRAAAGPGQCVGNIVDIHHARSHALKQSRRAGLARSDASDQPHALARRDLERHMIQRRDLVTRVGKRDIAKLNAAVNHRAMHKALIGGPLNWQIHHVVQGTQRRRRLMVTRQ